MEKTAVDGQDKNDLERYFYSNKGRTIHKWLHYFEVYDRHFSKYRNREITIVEIGVFKGGSLQMWKNYFGPKARIIGVDINPDCSAYAEEQIEIRIGSQEDRQFLRSLKGSLSAIDILIDDGGHTMKQQIATFEELFPHVALDGVYLCEDLHTSYWKNYGGGYRSPETFIEYSKNFIDYIHAWHMSESERAAQNRWYRPWQQELSVTDFTRSVHSLHYYDSILVIEKRAMEAPSHLMTGGELGAQA